MNPIFVAANHLQRLFDERRWPFCFIGGLAVQRWGEPRLTRDVDLTLLTGFGNEASFVDPLLARFEARVEAAREFALENRILLLRDENGIPLDLALGALPFEERTIKRSSPWTIDDSFVLRTCSAEDLVVHKAFAARDQDWIDIAGILDRQGRDSLDWVTINEELKELAPLKPDTDIRGRLLRSLRDEENR